MFSEPANRRSRVYTELQDIVERLGRIGVDVNHVLEAARRGHLDRLLATDLDFPGRGEYDAASTGLRTLAEISNGTWVRDSFLGIPVVVNGIGTVAIAVTAGDQFTGVNGDRDPRTRSLKGPATVQATTSPRLPLGESDYEDEIGVEFWYLLTTASETGLRIELSMPDITAADDYVRSWRERIVIGDVNLGGGADRRRPAIPIPPAPAVPVSRKTA